MLGAMDSRPRLVIDRDRRVVWQSDNAACLLAAPVPVHLAEGRLEADAVAADNALAEFVEGAGHQCNSMLVRGKCRRHWAMVLGWSPAERSDQVCLLFNLSVPHRSVVESGLAASLRLTAGEARVLDQFARLYSPREIAEKMGVSLSTVRSHLKQIHSKAGVETGIQLAQLVRGFCIC